LKKIKFYNSGYLKDSKDLRDIPPLDIPGRNISKLEEALIRSSDIALSILILCLMSPVILVIIVILKLSLKGSIFYTQERVGMGGKHFTIYKFRTMIADDKEAAGSTWVPMDDARVTRVGRILRRRRLDELPQLINVIKGDMSLVGPRPEMICRVQQHKALQGIRLSIKPGLTGLAQVEGYYDTRPRDKLRYDFIYIKNRSILFNLRILLKTIVIIITKPGT
jgi:lipopolysaccharide/colanic/teichoic acid biosynthesis glycosyltransferase